MNADDARYLAEPRLLHEPALTVTQTRRTQKAISYRFADGSRLRMEVIMPKQQAKPDGTLDKHSKRAVHWVVPKDQETELFGRIPMDSIACGQPLDHSAWSTRAATNPELVTCYDCAKLAVAAGHAHPLIKPAPKMFPT